MVGFNAARGFVCGARVYKIKIKKHLLVSMPHAALFVVQGKSSILTKAFKMFQCRTRLCLWCKDSLRKAQLRALSFNAARGFVCGAR